MEESLKDNYKPYHPFSHAPFTVEKAAKKGRQIIPYHIVSRIITQRGERLGKKDMSELPEEDISSACCNYVLKKKSQ